jgi:hypothetical protein
MHGCFANPFSNEAGFSIVESAKFVGGDGHSEESIFVLVFPVVVRVNADGST